MYEDIVRAISVTPPALGLANLLCGGSALHVLIG